MRYLTHIWLLILGVAALFIMGRKTTPYFSGALGLMVVEEGRSNLTMEALVLLITLVAVMGVLELHPYPDGVTLLATLGMAIIITSEDWLTLYLGIELQSLGFYTLTASKRGQLASGEAGLKYLVVGSVATGILLLGVGIAYGETGGLEARGAPVAITLALLIKSGAAPFHFWLPDAYHAAPTHSSAFFAVPAKLPLLWVLAKVSVSQDALWGCAVASLVIGVLGGLYQSNMKRLLAYSAIAHLGFSLIAIASCNLPPLIIYKMIYIPSALALFALVPRPHSTILGLEGLSRTDPHRALVVAVALFAIAGTPPLAGFLGKWHLISAVVAGGYIVVPAIAVIVSLIAAFYYLRIITILYFNSGPSFAMSVAIKSIVSGRLYRNWEGGVLAIVLFFLLVLPMAPNPLIALPYLAELNTGLVS